MDGNKIYIVVTDKPISGSGAQDKKTDKEETTLSEYAQNQFYHFVRNEAKKIVNAGISSVGTYTGNYLAQQRVNELMGSASSLMNLGMAVKAGAKYGLGGALIAGVVATGAMMISDILQFKAYENQISNLNYSTEQLRKRAGLNTLNDGSRGTEN